MLSSDDISPLYDFENVLESALQALFNTAQIKSFTSQDFGKFKADGSPVIDFQKERPRVEIIFIVGAGQGQFRPLTIDDLEIEVPVETSFKGQYRLDIVTAVNIAIHSAYRNRIRAFMHTQLIGLNGMDPMTRHRIQRFHQDGGTSPTYKPDDGTLRTILSFNIDFSIQDEAWPIPANPTPPVPPTSESILDDDSGAILDDDATPVLSD